VAHPVRRQAMRPPDALHRGDADPDDLGHGRRRPVFRLVRRLGRGQGDDLVDHLLAERRDARGSGLVAQEAVDAFLGEAFLPAPHAGLRLLRPAHDLDRAAAIGGQKHDLGPPDMLLRRIAVADDRLKGGGDRRR